MTQTPLPEPTAYRVFLREPGNPFKDFDTVDEAWTFAQSFVDQGPEKVPYIHPLRPGGPDFPVRN